MYDSGESAVEYESYKEQDFEINSRKEDWYLTSDFSVSLEQNFIVVS